CLQSKNSWTF
nr:immunoglobulin light chain junction region [Macaca mulatta]